MTQGHGSVYALGERAFRFLLYGNLWIALCALAHSWQSQYLLLGTLPEINYPAFLFFGTLAQYGLHRLISLRRHKSGHLSPRFRNIQALRWWLRGLTALSLLLALAFGWQLRLQTQLFLSGPVALSLLYVLPFWRGRRLRDFPYIKIFLIAAVWSLLTNTGTAIELGLARLVSVWLQFPERLLFLFAITIPFDIRDLELDRQMPVRTIPATLGIQGSKVLALTSLGLSALLFLWQGFWDWYAWPFILGALPSYLLAGSLIRYSHPKRPDRYYTFFLDGTLVLQAVGVLVAGWVAESGWMG